VSAEPSPQTSDLFEKLRASEERTGLILDQALDAVVMMDADGLITRWNPQAECIFGWSRDEAVGRRMSETIIPEKYRAAHERGLRHFLSTGEGPLLNQRVEMTALRRDGREFPVELTITPVKMDGTVVFSAFLRDITERKLAEEKLRTSEERTRLILDKALDAVVMMNADGLIIGWNPQAESVFGWSRDEAMGRCMSETIIPAEFRAAHESGLRHFLATGEGPLLNKRVEMTAVRRDGREFPVELTVTPLQMDGASVFSGFLRDISERKRAEERIKQDEEELRLLIEGIPQLIWRAQPDGSIDYHNQRLLAYHGRTMEEVRGFGYANLIYADDREKAVRAWREAVSKGSPYENQARLLGADGQYRWFLTRGLPLRDAQGRILAWYGTCTDIDEVTRLREQVERERDYLREEVREARAFGEIIGQSEAIRKVQLQAEQVAGTPATVLLIGETGTGKELLARAIHNLSPRHARPMVTLNCAALPATLMESELFGREKGAYTGALTRQIGRFELADGSTLFLDEIGELPLELQAKLLRILQEGQFERLGSSKPIKADVRIIAATNRDLEKAVKEGRFREDLYYRLNVFPITMPPLRERREDIPLLVSAFAKDIVRTLGKTIDAIPRSTLAELQQYPWPGNIRELRNVVERALIVCRGSTVRFDLPAHAGTSAVAAPHPKRTLEEVERQHILSVLEETGWRVSGKRGAAAILGLHRSTLESRMAKLGIKRSS
jgi:formate hydrogenlyase transcriptional activator